MYNTKILNVITTNETKEENIKINFKDVLEKILIIIKPLLIFASYLIITLSFFVFGLMEHPETPILSRLFTSIAQSSILYFIGYFLKPTCLEIYFTCKEILEAEDDEENL